MTRAMPRDGTLKVLDFAAADAEYAVKAVLAPQDGADPTAAAQWIGCHVQDVPYPFDLCRGAALTQGVLAEVLGTSV